MIKKQLFILLITSLAISQAFSHEKINNLSTDQHQVYSKVESNSYSEPMPIKQLINDLEGSNIKDGEVAFTHNQFEIGHRNGAWELAVFWRYDYLLTFSPDTAWLFYLENNDKEINQQKNFNVNLNANHIESQGAAIGYSFHLLSELAVKTRVNYLKPSSMTYGYLIGDITTSSNDYSGTLLLDYSYKHDTIFNRPEESISGQGLGVDIDIFWQLTKNISLYAQGRDVFSYIKWSEVTYSEATALSDRVSYDENGSINVIPNVSGFHGYRDQIQRLPNRYLFDLNYQLKNWQVALQLYRYDKFNFPRIKFGTKGKTINWNLGYDLKTNGVELGLAHHNFSFKVQSEQLSWNKAHDLSFSLSVNYLI